MDNSIWLDNYEASGSLSTSTDHKTTGTWNRAKTPLENRGDKNLRGPYVFLDISLPSPPLSQRHGSYKNSFGEGKQLSRPGNNSGTKNRPLGDNQVETITTTLNPSQRRRVLGSQTGRRLPQLDVLEKHVPLLSITDRKEKMKRKWNDISGRMTR